MTVHIDNLATIASKYDAIVLDQWGVLHDGSTPYSGSIVALENLQSNGSRLAVLSNSGKRSAPNTQRIADMGFKATLFDQVMTSGEALWRDIANGSVAQKRFFAIDRNTGDALAWLGDLEISLVENLDIAEAVILMGLPDGETQTEWQTVMDRALALNLPVYCSNPDRASPRAGGEIVISPGALAFDYRDKGGTVVFYGKPHHPIFEALQKELGANRLLMVGDSLEHDIAGAQSAGWDSLLVRGGLYAREFATRNIDTTLTRLVTEKGCQPPTYSIEVIR